MEILLISIGVYLVIGLCMGVCAFKEHMFHKKAWLRKDAWQNVGLSAILWSWAVYELYKQEKNAKQIK